MAMLSPLRPEIVVGLTAVILAVPRNDAVSAADGEPPRAVEVVRSLAALGSRESGSVANRRARVLLGEVLRGQCGADSDGSGRTGSGTVGGRWQGTTDSEIVLAAHYDTLPNSRGVADNASGCGVVVASACDLSRSPRYRTLRVLLFDAEEEGLRGSRNWLAARGASYRSKVDAAITAELVGLSSALGRVVYPVTGGHRDSLTTPAWLIFAALEAARALDLDLAVADVRWSIFAQLAMKIATSTRTTDSQTFAAAGIPSLTISDVSMTERTPTSLSDDDRLEQVDEERLHSSAELLSAIVLQVDRIRHRRLTDDEYLVALDRVWIRRDLLWVGLALWAPMVFRGLPGRWRGASSETRRQRGKGYLPGFAFRMLFLVCMVLIPTLSSMLVYPSALVALMPDPPTMTARRLLAATAFLPLIVFSVWIAFAQIGGFLVLQRESVLPTLLILLTLTAFWRWRVGQRPFHLA